LRNTLGASAFDARVHAFGSRARSLQLRDGDRVRQRPLAELATLPPQPTILLHTAFLTKDRAEWMAEADYVAENQAIRATVLGSLDRIGVDRLFLASSGAAERADDPAASPAMRLYGTLKHDDEEAFAEWAEKTSHSVITARLFALSGPYINKPETYALASFILDALAGKRIRVHARRPVVRGYVAIREVLSLVFALLGSKSGALRFDTGGEAMELGDAASIISDTLGGSGVDRPAATSDMADHYAGDDAAYRQLLRSVGMEHIPFRQQVIETADYLSKSVQIEEALSA